MGKVQAPVPTKAKAVKPVVTPRAAVAPAAPAELTPVGLIEVDKLAHPIKDAPAIVGVSKATLYRLIKAGKLQTRNVGGATVVRRVDLQALLDSAPLARNAAQ